MDNHSRQIVVALVLIIGLAAVAVIVSLLVPYNVTFDAQITDLEGTASIEIPNRVSKPVDAAATTKLRLNQTLKLEPGSTATITFDINGGRAVIEGPAELRLVTSQRSATTIGHLRGSGDYTLVVEQDGGTVRYYFDNADPSIDDTDITIWVNHAANDIVPLTEPCWLAEASDTGPAVSAPITCP